MTGELHAITAAGERLVKLADGHVPDLAARAGQHDRDATPPADNFDDMRRSGLLAACVPEQFGGLGVDSLHDVSVAIGRLARGCASTAIAVNMHMTGLWGLTRYWRDVKSAGDAQSASLIEMFLPMCGASQVIVCGASTEPGTDLRHPNTTCTPVDGGFVLDGRKSFATNSAIADIFAVIVRAGDRLATAFVLKGAEGMTVSTNWDSLGMRASVSNDIVFERCFVPEAMVFMGPAWGEFDERSLLLELVNFPLAGAFLGIAEAARDAAVEWVRTRKRNGEPLVSRAGVRHQVAEIEVRLGAARGALSRTAQLVDDYVAPRALGDMTIAGLQELNMHWQAMKIVVQRAAIEAVDHALTATGGAGYMSGHVLSRLYRDVRAGPFMQPYSPNEAYDFIGGVALGLGSEPG